MSPWPRQHKLASLSGQNLPFHLKGAQVPKLTETMSFASPHSPNSGSSSQCQPTHERIPPPVKVQVRGSWHLPLSTPRLLCGPIARPRPHADEQKHEEHRGTDHVVRHDAFFTQSPAAEREERTFPLSRHPGTTIHLTWLFSPTVSNPTLSKQHCPAQVAQEH